MEERCPMPDKKIDYKKEYKELYMPKQNTDDRRCACNIIFDDRRKRRSKR